MEKLKITEHANKKSKHLSGGTKRKLAFAISMFASPNISLLDEPSTGMDPTSKRVIYLKYFIKKEKINIKSPNLRFFGIPF